MIKRLLSGGLGPGIPILSSDARPADGTGGRRLYHLGHLISVERREHGYDVHRAGLAAFLPRSRPMVRALSSS